MRISESGVLNCGEPGTSRAISTFPTVTTLPDGTLLATYRVGTTKDSDDETIEIRRSQDGGRTWNSPVSPFETTFNGTPGSLKVAYVTVMSDELLIVAALWVDREAYPGKPLFNDETEGCLPMAILLSDSHDLGMTWTPWRKLRLPTEIGPPSLTSPLIKLPSGRLAVSVESNKNYHDASQWFQKVVYAYSADCGNSWSAPVTVCEDPTTQVFNWDQRAGLLPDNRLVTLTWTYDRVANRYLSVHRRLSSDEGASWTTPEDLGFADQPSHPAILPDGRVVVAWVDRFQSRSIRARMAEMGHAPFLSESEVVIHAHEAQCEARAGQDGSTGNLLTDMIDWSFGLPFAESLHDGDVMVVYYEGSALSMTARWVRISL